MLYWWAQSLRGEPVMRVLRELEGGERAPAERLRGLQAEYTRRLLKHAYEQVPFYRESWSKVGFAPGDWDAPEALASLPVLEKREVQEQGVRMRAEGRHPALRAKTSGSSGTPVSVLRSHDSWAHAHANQIRAWRWHGVEVGERHAYFWGLALEAAGRRQAGLKDWFFNRDRCSAFTLDGPRAAEFYARLRRHPTSFALGYPSALAQFASELRARGLDGRALGWRAIVTTAEVLHPHQRTLLRDTFGAAIVNLYGCAEAGVLAMECERGGMHVPVESVALQWMDGANHGTPREVLVTDLHNLAQPLVRYRAGDLIETASEPCACGRPLPVIGAIAGRAGDTLILPDGRQVNANLPSYVFKHHAEAGTVQEYQFVQFPDGRVELRIKPGPGFGEATAREIRTEVAHVLGLQVDLKLLERFERSARGKHRDFVRAEES
jgi:phenylacetate-CoA ligase